MIHRDIWCPPFPTLCPCRWCIRPKYHYLSLCLSLSLSLCTTVPVHWGNEGESFNILNNRVSFQTVLGRPLEEQFSSSAFNCIAFVWNAGRWNVVWHSFFPSSSSIMRQKLKDTHSPKLRNSICKFGSIWRRVTKLSWRNRARHFALFWKIDSFILTDVRAALIWLTTGYVESNRHHTRGHTLDLWATCAAVSWFSIRDWLLF